MLFQALAIARNAFIEAIRQPILFVLVLLSGGFQIYNTANTGFSMGLTESSEVAADDKLLFDIGLGTVFVIGTLLAGFIATAVMSREIENKTVLTVVSKPVGRPVLVLGKYLGVAGAIMVASVIMLVFLMLAIRHGVMSTTSEVLDKPVLVLGLGSVALAMALAGWCNYFYGWSFPQSVILLLLPLILIAYFVVLFLGKDWGLQHPVLSIKPQVTIACLCLLLAILVLTAVATAASTRFGQVMTIVICLGVFVLALLSNHLFGRRVFTNEAVGMIAYVRPEEPTKPDFLKGERFRVELEQDPTASIKPGANIQYGPTPNGYPLVTAFSSARFEGDVTDSEVVLGAGAPAAVIAERIEGRRIRIRHVGGPGTGAAASRPPEQGDYVFLGPTRVNPVAMGVWGVVPNLQFFWLLDAVSQNRPVPVQYLAMALLYALVQIGAFLSLGVILFQKRDVG